MRTAHRPRSVPRRSLLRRGAVFSLHQMPSYAVVILLTVLLVACGAPAANSTAGSTAPAETVPAATSSSGTAVTVSAASDLTPAFTELGALFERETGTAVTFNFGSTGQLAQQIERGAPVDVFAAANVSFVEGLEKLGLILPDTKALYAVGRITLWTRADSPLKTERIEDLARNEVAKVAIANPEHAPYGMAAREALQAAGVWQTVEPKLVFGENVAQTLTLADTGNVDAAIVALSLSVQSTGRWTLIPAELHQPLNQALVVVKSSPYPEAARRFAAFLNGPTGRPIMQKYGFVLPGEEVAR